jgi:hypothetical protein
MVADVWFELFSQVQRFLPFFLHSTHKPRMSNNKTTNADGSGTFYDFISLCKEIEKEPSYNNKTELVKTFIKNHDKIDLYLLCKLLCCKDDKRVYNMKEKQLVKVLSRIWKSNHADMISDLSNGDFTETAKKVIFLLFLKLSLQRRSCKEINRL